MTGPEGNSEFCFPRISMFPETTSRETLRFKGNKIHLPRPQSPAYSNSIINYWVGAQGIMGRRGNAELFFPFPSHFSHPIPIPSHFSLPIAPCARAHHSLPAFARSFLLAPSLPIAFARRNKYEKPVEEAENSLFPKGLVIKWFVT